MRQRLNQLLVLARLTAMESVRQPVCLLIAIVCVVATIAVPMVVTHNLGEEGRLARDSGLAFHLVFGVFLAGYAACSALAREIHSGTAAAVLCKPVPREIFFASKFVGVAVPVVLFSCCAAIATLLAERISERLLVSPPVLGYVIDWTTGRLVLAAPCMALGLAAILNFRFGLPFQSTAFGLLLLCMLLAIGAAGCFNHAGIWAPYDLRVNLPTIGASLLVTMALVVLSSLAVTLSTRLSTVPTMALCCVALLGGLLSEHLFGRHADTSAVCALLYALIPNWQRFWQADALAHGGSIQTAVIAAACLYGCFYAAAVTCIGALLFRHTEIS